MSDRVPEPVADRVAGRVADRVAGRRVARAGGPAPDAGVVAILVALSVSTFVLGFAALAVDLGSAYARRAEMRSIADRLALAGAKALPDAQAAVAAIDGALVAVCADERMPGLCDGTTSLGTAWTTDGDPANGEVDFFRDPNSDARYDDAAEVAPVAADASALRVRLPASTVEFGLAASFGYDSAAVSGTATARVGSALAAGLLPFALTREDVNRGVFCARDPAAAAAPSADAVQLAVLGTPPPFAPGQRNRDVEIRLTPSAGVVADSVEFRYLVGPPPRGDDGQLRTPAVTNPDPDALTFRVPIPDGLPGVTEYIWAAGELAGGGTFETTYATVQYTGTATGTPPVPPVTGGDLCDQPVSNRGYGRLPRTDTTDAMAVLTRNVRVSPTAQLYPDAPGFPDLRGIGCLSLPASSCLQSSLDGWGDAVTRGMFVRFANRDGRLIGDCGNGTTSSNGRNGIDDSRLFVDPGFLDPTRGGGGTVLKERLDNQDGTRSPLAEAGNEGWITSLAMRCPRLGVMPVVRPGVALGGQQAIDSFTYVWIDDDTSRGLDWNGGRLRSFSGYVVDPAYLPELVSGSRVIGPYLGPGLPRQVQLIPDPGGP